MAFDTLFSSMIWPSTPCRLALVSEFSSVRLPSCLNSMALTELDPMSRREVLLPRLF